MAKDGTRNLGLCILVAFFLLVAASVSLVAVWDFLRSQNSLGDAKSQNHLRSNSNKNLGMVTLSPYALLDAKDLEDPYDISNEKLRRSLSGSEGPRIEEIQELSGLLTELEMTGDRKFLDRAQALFPGDPSVIMLSALWSESEDSEWLARLEDLQPENALPDIMRASFAAKESDSDKFFKEMKNAIGKPILNTLFAERMQRILDEMIKSGRFPEGVLADHSLDRPFILHQGRITSMLSEGGFLNGFDKGDVADIKLAWAKKLQSLQGLDHFYPGIGMVLEHDALRGFPMDDLYGDRGITVGGRREELMGALRSQGEKLAKYSELMYSDDGDSSLAKQFFARLALDGESAAVNWLMQR